MEVAASPDLFLRALEATQLLHLGPAAHLRLQSLRGQLLARGVAADDPRIPAWLAAALCRSGAERQAFLTLFTRAPEEERGAARSAADGIEAPPGEPTPPSGTPPRWWRSRLLPALILVALALAIGTAPYYFEHNDAVKNKAVERPIDNPGKLSDSRGRTGNIYSVPNWPGIWPLFLPVGAAAAFSLYELGRRRQIRHDHVPEPQRRLALVVAEGAHGLMTGRDWRGGLRHLRRHRAAPGRRLDLRATMRATIAVGGLPQLRFRSRALSPEYLLLSERVSPRDHLAWHARLLARRMGQEQITLDHFEFAGDPRRLRIVPQGWEQGQEQRRGQDGRETQPLANVLGLHARAHPVLLAESYDTLAPDAGAAWVEMIGQAPTPVLLDPRPSACWNLAERRARDAGIMPFAFDPRGLSACAAHLERPADHPAAMSGGFDLPQSLTDGSAMLRDRTAPPALVVDGLIDDLEAWLSRPGLEWLQGLALFPYLQPALTVHMGMSLTDGAGIALIDEDRLLRLSRLPWFRAGRMPDWLRLALVRGLSPERLARATEAIQAFLLPQKEGAVRIDLAAGADPRARAKLIAWLRLSPASPLADRILVDALRGGRPAELGLEVPSSLRAWLAPLWRSRIVRAWLLALVATSAMIALQYPASLIRPATRPQFLSPVLPAIPDADRASEAVVGASGNAPVPTSKPNIDMTSDNASAPVASQTDAASDNAMSGSNEAEAMNASDSMANAAGNAAEVEIPMPGPAVTPVEQPDSGDVAIMNNDRAQSEMLDMRTPYKGNIDMALQRILLNWFDTNRSGAIDGAEAGKISCQTLKVIAGQSQAAGAVTGLAELYFAPRPVGSIGFDATGRAIMAAKVEECFPSTALAL